MYNKSNIENMRLGTKLHEILELIDFKNPNYDNLDIDDFYKNKIKKFLSLIDVRNLVNVYKEYEFMYEDNDSLYHGIIDLMLEYDDYFMLIDYKLKNVDDSNYIKQLNVYKNYLSKKTNKKIDIYLFSILTGSFDKIS